MRVAANLNFLFTGLPWALRPAAARAAGADAVEFPWPSLEVDAVRAALGGGAVALLNMDAGDLGAGERGYPNVLGRVTEWRVMADRALDLARTLGAPLVNVLAGVDHADAPGDGGRGCLVENLRWLLPRAATAGVGLVVEPINTRE
ncbi:MAG: TIM barrel protein, partial [Actinomycetota bacterium]|nr:TIM barrel protein [Actinomycetota bacterium]